jgi:PAS domain S-box-containing protein
MSGRLPSIGGVYPEVAMETEQASCTVADLLDSEAKYRALFSSIDAGFCIVRVEFDASNRAIDYQFLEVNPAFENQTGLINAQGRWMRTLAPAHEQHWFDIYGSIALTGTPLRFERPAAALDDRWYEVYAFRIGHPGEHRVAILFNDISSRKRSEAALEQANSELEQMFRDLRRANEDLEQFARIAGHDLKAPLRNIIQLSQLLARRFSHTDLEGDTQELLEQIAGCGNRLASLVDDLLRYATVSQSPTHGLGPCRAGLACSQSLENLRLTIEESGASVECRIPQDCTVAVDFSMLTLTFQNLVSNGLQYRRIAEDPKVSITAKNEGNYWKFAVEDNGEGIQQEFTKKIFEPFQRLHGQERPGSGIGLATCKRIVERAGGIIWVESRIGEGSTFYFSLPSA